MPAQRVVPELIAHQPVQSLEAFAHIHGFDGDIDFRRQPQPEHAITPRPRESAAAGRLRRIATSFRSAGRWPAPARILPAAAPPLLKQPRPVSAYSFECAAASNRA